MSTSELPAGRLDPDLRSRASAAAGSIPIDIWAVAFLVLLAAAIRFGTIAHQSFWTDEALTVFEVRSPFGSMLHTVAHVETTPPLYFLMIWGWGKLFGTTELALRSLSALAGCALVPIAYACARTMISRRAGVIAAAFVTFNPFLIWYSQEARAYMLLAALLGASLLFFVRALDDPSPANLAWWALFSSLALMTHFFAGFGVAPEAIWLLWVWRTRAVGLAVGVVVLAELAMVPFALFDTGHGVQWIALTSRFYRIGQVPIEFGVDTLFRRYTPTQGVIAGSLLLLGAVVLLVARGDESTRRGARVFGAIAAAGMLVPLLLGFFGQDYFLARNMIGSWLPVALVLAAACAVPRARLVGTSLAVALVVMFIAAQIDIDQTAAFQRPAWRTLAHAMGRATVTRAILVAGGSSADPLKIYLPHVRWEIPLDQRNRIYELDVIGTTKRLRLAPHGLDALSITTAGIPGRRFGSPVPRLVGPRGTMLVAHFRSHEWTVSRFVFAKPKLLDTSQLLELAPHYFRRTPSSLLAIVQHPGS